MSYGRNYYGDKTKLNQYAIDRLEQTLPALSGAAKDDVQAAIGKLEAENDMINEGPKVVYLNPEASFQDCNDIVQDLIGRAS